MQPMAINAAVNATRQHALSALPGAPVIEEPPRSRRPWPARLDRLRRSTALVLRRHAARGR